MAVTQYLLSYWPQNVGTASFAGNTQCTQFAIDITQLGVRYEHQSTFKAPDSSIVCPVYLNSTRTVLVTNWRLNTPADEKNVTFLQRGIALVLWFSG